MAKRKIALSGPGAINAARNARRGVVDGPPGASGHNALELIGAHKRLLRSSSHAVAAVHRTPCTADNCIAPRSHVPYTTMHQTARVRNRFCVTPAQ